MTSTMGLYRDTRRFVRFGRLALLPILGGILFLLLSLYALVPLVGDYRTANRMLKEGKNVEAIVTACRESRTGDGTVYGVSVQAPGFENFSFDRKDQLGIGAKVMLKYLEPEGGVSYFNPILCIESSAADTTFGVMNKLSKNPLWRRFLILGFCIAAGLTGVFIWMRMLRGSAPRHRHCH